MDTIVLVVYVLLCWKFEIHYKIWSFFFLSAMYKTSKKYFCSIFLVVSVCHHLHHGDNDAETCCKSIFWMFCTSTGIRKKERNMQTMRCESNPFAGAMERKYLSWLVFIKSKFPCCVTFCICMWILRVSIGLTNFRYVQNIKKCFCTCLL